MKNKQTQDYDDDIAFNVIDKSTYHETSYIRDSSQFNKDDEQVLNNIKYKQKKEYLEHIRKAYLDAHDAHIQLNNSLNYEEHKRYALKLDESPDRKMAFKFIAILFLLGTAIWLIVSAPTLPSAGIAKGKYYIFEDHNKAVKIQQQNLLDSNKKSNSSKEEKK